MSSRPKQSMSELKLRRLLEHNQRLREDLSRPRIKVSEASASLIRYCKTTKDHLVRPCSFRPFLSFSFFSLAPTSSHHSAHLYPHHLLSSGFLCGSATVCGVLCSTSSCPFTRLLLRSDHRKRLPLLSLQVPSVWGPVGKNEDPYAPQTKGGCCIVQ